MSFIEFLLEYYIYILAVLVILIVGVIGFLVDSKNKEKSKNKELNVNNDSNNQASLNDNVPVKEEIVNTSEVKNEHAMDVPVRNAPVGMQALNEQAMGMQMSANDSVVNSNINEIVSDLGNIQNSSEAMNSDNSNDNVVSSLNDNVSVLNEQMVESIQAEMVNPVIDLNVNAGMSMMNNSQNVNNVSNVNGGVPNLQNVQSQNIKPQNIQSQMINPVPVSSSNSNMSMMNINQNIGVVPNFQPKSVQLGMVNSIPVNNVNNNMGMNNVAPSVQSQMGGAMSTKNVNFNVSALNNQTSVNNVGFSQGSVNNTYQARGVNMANSNMGNINQNSAVLPNGNPALQNQAQVFTSDGQQPFDISSMFNNNI